MRTEDLPVSGTVRSRVGLRASGARAETLNPRPLEFVALARLLRELDDVAALRSSPLLTEAFAKPDRSAYAAPEGMALLRARAAVLSAIASLDSGPSGRNIHFARQRAIVTRCDLRGEKHAKVANDLGISLREFYRERRRAFERLLASIPSNLAVPERAESTQHGSRSAYEEGLCREALFLPPLSRAIAHRAYGPLGPMPGPGQRPG